MEKSEKNFLEKLADAVPGLKGYRAKEERRETDKRLRDYIASRLDRVKDKIDAVKLELTNQGNLQPLGEIGTLQRQVQRLTETIRFASYGYSGFFDQMKIREAELDRIYDHDMKLLDAVELIESAVLGLGRDGAPFSAAVRNLDDLVAARKTMWEAPQGS